MLPKTRLGVAAAVWAGAGVATLVARFVKRRRNEERERRTAAAGGLIPAARTVVDALAARASYTADAPALVGADGASYTWEAYHANAVAFGKALTALGGRGGVAVHAFNEPRWFFAAVGALAAGWTISGVYLTNTYEQSKHILKTSRVRVLVVETREQLESTSASVLDDFPELVVVVLEGGAVDGDRVFHYDAFVATGAALDDRALPRMLPSTDVASLVYTSGTTGNPKAVELTHESARTVCEMMHARIPLNESTVLVSYLPLSHIAALGIDVYSAIFCGATVHFADADALRGSLKTTLLAARPTLFFGVPRVWEKMAAAMQATAAKTYATSKAKQVIGTAAKAVGAAWWDPATPEVARGALALPMGLFKVLAFKKIRKACGLDRCELLYTGAAPLSAATADYLKSVDMPLLEVFGMSESCGAIAIAPDGEVLWRGGNVMRGYAGRAEATAAALDDGYLRTGDLGELVGGFLRITGRKKDLIITAGGENVAPAPVEERFCDALGGHAVLVGDRRKFLSLLLAPPEGGAAPAPDAVKAALDAYNAAAMSRAQRVQKVSVLPAPFSVETEELTPTMKLKRAFVIAKYQSQVDDMYRDGPTIAYGAAVGESN
ncbi:decanoate-CoA ligase [Aureococcus anophagefferens]|nr:decanoate-CoA ligase [Aureococcus anophagefferens]